MTGPNLAVHRRRLRQAMTARCEVTTPGRQTFDPSTGEYTDGPPHVHYDGPCLVRPTPWQSRIVQVSGGAEVGSTRTYDVWLEADADIAVEQTLTVTASRGDPALVGVPLKVIDVPYDEYQLARRAVVQSAA
jgi:hypothetical protein